MHEKQKRLLIKGVTMAAFGIGALGGAGCTATMESEAQIAARVQTETANAATGTPKPAEEVAILGNTPTAVTEPTATLTQTGITRKEDNATETAGEAQTTPTLTAQAQPLTEDINFNPGETKRVKAGSVIGGDIRMGGVNGENWYDDYEISGAVTVFEEDADVYSEYGASGVYTPDAELRMTVTDELAEQMDKRGCGKPDTGGCDIVSTQSYPNHPKQYSPSE